MWQHLKLSAVGLGTRPRYSLVVEEAVKKPNKQTQIQRRSQAISRCWISIAGKEMYGQGFLPTAAIISVHRDNLKKAHFLSSRR